MFEKYHPDLEIQVLAIALDIAAMCIADLTGSQKEVVLKEIFEGAKKVMHETRRSPPLPEATENPT